MFTPEQEDIIFGIKKQEPLHHYVIKYDLSQLSTKRRRDLVIYSIINNIKLEYDVWKIEDVPKFTSIETDKDKYYVIDTHMEPHYAYYDQMCIEYHITVFLV